ncbi:hypothetical protein LSH36_6g13000 [Paralvinella palmiformis]|uniref:Glutaredoxin domain-containing protein n=1 Tax=Paralvinella palmiformis TaxID=53620 RepID=A0AAD9KEQ7_9ANNE|nr:hypothetical protein LSH36_6g13000 [Paralvinella palmiformis]
MAAPMSRISSFICQTRYYRNSSNVSHKAASYLFGNNTTLFSHSVGNRFRKFSTFSGTAVNRWLFRSKHYMLMTAGVAIPFVYLVDLYRRSTVVFADVGGPFQFKPIRSVRSDGDSTGLKLTMFQYQTCPFCCKARAYLDYRSFSYDVIEVNSVWRKEIKWSKYKKVPILVIQGIGPDGYLQINDSSVIISVLETFLDNRTLTLDKILEFYPGLETKNERGKAITDWPNKYFVMMNERKLTPSLETEQKKVVSNFLFILFNFNSLPELYLYYKEERDWREWTDQILIHTLAPNMYRTLSESKEAFDYFSEVGEWQKVFTTSERLFVIYVGTLAMYILGKILKRRHHLKDDVRLSLYDACKEWMKAIGPNRQFLGGDTPNLADISVYGVLSSFEGCQSFKDVLSNTDIGPWYSQMKKLIEGLKGHVLP